MGHKTNFRILVVDDDCDILDLIEYNLTREGFKVKTEDDSTKAIDVAKDFEPDLVILDIMMPQPNGIEICRKLRSIKKFRDTYIFFLTAKSESYYVQAALDTGGDDFIEKVVGLRALTYKVSSVLKRRYVIRKSIEELKLGSLLIHRKSSSITVNNKELVLSKPEFELLFFFAQNANKSITLETLLRNIWGSEVYLFETSIDVYIQSLIKKIGFEIIHKTPDNRYQLEAHS
jgi:two-component system, OmpR family, alkaline phosphatase synthesis response regulator PhoP